MITVSRVNNTEENLKFAVLIVIADGRAEPAVVSAGIAADHIIRLHFRIGIVNPCQEISGKHDISRQIPAVPNRGSRGPACSVTEILIDKINKTVGNEQFTSLKRCVFIIIVQPGHIHAFAIQIVSDNHMNISEILMALYLAGINITIGSGIVISHSEISVGI